jgi:hypothetical protein
MSILLFCKDKTGWLEGQLQGEATHNQQQQWCMQHATDVSIRLSGCYPFVHDKYKLQSYL